MCIFQGSQSDSDVLYTALEWRIKELAADGLSQLTAAKRSRKSD
jgi:hypothetical protein